MKYYAHHIGDFDRATRHLTRLERSIYRDLIEVYYDSEKPLTLDVAVLCRKILARSEEEATAVEQTLNEFFTKTPTGWYHERCEEEIEKFRNSTSQKSQAGKASAAKRATAKQQAINGIPTSVEAPVGTVDERPNDGESTIQYPLTNNHKPNKETSEQSSDCPLEDLQGGLKDKARKHHGSEKDHELAHWLFDLVLTVNATAKEPNWNSWANDIRMMTEIDKRSHHDIGALFKWAKQETFWGPHIQSPGKLREKWDTLTEQRNRAPQTGRTSRSGETIEQINARVRAEFLGIAPASVDEGRTIDMVQA